MRLKGLKVLPNRPLRSADRILLAASGSCFLILLALSLFLFLRGSPWAQRTLFFPEPAGKKLVGETRLLPKRPSLDGNVELLVRELILGPTRPMLKRLLPRDTRLQSVLVRQGSVYVSLSREMLHAESEAPYSPQEALEALGTVILYNFPRIRSLHLLIEGQVPAGWGKEGVRFRRRLLG